MRKILVIIAMLAISVYSNAQRYRISTGYADPRTYPSMRNPVYSQFDGTPYEVKLSTRRYNQNTTNNKVVVVPVTVNSETVERHNPSDVDVNIPVSKYASQENTLVLVIANENYENVPKVKYAINDGEIFAKYCEQTLNIPSYNIHTIKNASSGKMFSELAWLTNNMNKIGDDCRVILYYSGHGIPDEYNNSLYFLPVDGNASDTMNACSLYSVFTTLSSVPSKNITIFMDTCFGVLDNSRGIGIRVKYPIENGNFVVFSATKDDEKAYPYDEKGHGMFTYFLLKKMQETRGNVNYGTLADYLIRNVDNMSTRINNKSQTPTVVKSSSLSQFDEWRNLRLIN